MVFIKRITVGMFAHVDAGKTTLSEGFMYLSGEIRNLGRVDEANTHLDTDEIERARGITVFSHQAQITAGDTEITLLDTPGHTDFVSEAERTISVLDYAILIISASDGIQGHTKTLWEILKNSSVPTFIFINKTDLPDIQLSAIIEELKRELSDAAVDFLDSDRENLSENIALCDEEIMHAYLDGGKTDKELVKKAICARKLFPVFYGSALKMEGVERFLSAIDELTCEKTWRKTFGARVFKIGTDEKQNRLTFMKITGGELKVKDALCGEKVNEIRIYKGDKYVNTAVAPSGTVCAVTGLSGTYAGMGLGAEEKDEKLTIEPIFSYRVLLPDGVDALGFVTKLKLLEEEETQLCVKWNEELGEIELRLMGEIQTEILKHRIKKRFGVEVDFLEGRVVYKETIKDTAYGVGHFEPLRHYAEVHLLLKPLKRGMGMHFKTDVSEDLLDKNWQRLIMTHLMEKTHRGVLTGSPVTDIEITLVAGRAHNKHTEGGDFRQATYRAVRNGLRYAQSELLEPYYAFSLEIPKENVGRAMTDLDQMGAEISIPSSRGNFSKITGRVAANSIRSYQMTLTSYTHGQGKLSVKFDGYDTCQSPEKVMEEIGYLPDNDTENTADSVFCEHGAGFVVPWNEVREHMHLPSLLKPKKTENTEILKKQLGVVATDGELLRIFERTYGKVGTKIPQKVMRSKKETTPYEYRARKKYDKEYLLIDGYNIIFAWEDLKALAQENLEAARGALVERMKSYRAFCDLEIIIVFDAYKVKGNVGEVERVGDLTIVYTKEAQTADSYIEKAARELSKSYKVTVATSDSLEQLIVFGSGAYRMSAKAFKEEVLLKEEQIRKIIKDYNIKSTDSDFFNIIKEKLDAKKNQNC